MELRHLRYFITVAEELNFSKAALKLYTAQPSLSQQIKDLEEDVGVQLLHRTKRKVELTEEGAVFLEQARLTLAQADKAIAMARQVSQAKQQMLRIGFVPVAEMKIFPYVLPNLRVQNPELKIELLSLNNLEQMKLLQKGELDITFTRNNFHNDEVESQFVLREPLIFILPKDHPLAKYERIPVKALNGIDFIIPSAEQSLTLNQAILDFAKANGAIGTGPSAALTHGGDQSYFDLIQPWMNSAAHDRGMLVHVYTLDAPVDFKKAMAAGVDGIFTNRASELLTYYQRPVPQSVNQLLEKNGF